MPPTRQDPAVAVCHQCCALHGRQHERYCVDCLEQAVYRAAALDALDLALGKCVGAGLDEIHIRSALVMVIDGLDGPLPRGGPLRRVRGEDGYEWDIDSTGVRPVTAREGSELREAQLGEEGVMSMRGLLNVDPQPRAVGIHRVGRGRRGLGGR